VPYRASRKKEKKAKPATEPVFAIHQSMNIKNSAFGGRRGAEKRKKAGMRGIPPRDLAPGPVAFILLCGAYHFFDAFFQLYARERHIPSAAAAYNPHVAADANHFKEV
jgi:hypothetical protein